MTQRKGIILAGENGWGDGYALGVAKSYSVNEIAAAFGGEVRMIDGYPGRAESHNDMVKAREELGWRPTLDVLDYIRDFVQKHPRGKLS